MSSKLLPCFLLTFDGVTRSTEKRSAGSVNGPDPIDKRMGTEAWLDSFVPILLSIRSVDQIQTPRTAEPSRENRNKR
jgi:hypothetical protein